MIPQADGAAAELRLGFACRWGRVRELTWSGSSLQLFQALDVSCDLTDLPVGPSRPLRAVLHRAERLGLSRGTPWSMTALEDWRAQRQLDHHARAADVDAILQIGDLGATSVPYYPYIDLTYRAVASAGSPLGGTGVTRLTAATLRRKEARQDHLFARASGILTMGSWIADDLVKSGIPASKVHVVGAGCNVATAPRLRSPDPSALRLLFLGRDFIRKGGDAVVEAVALCRENGDQHTLTVAGPARWPLSGPVPEGVRFLGPVPAAAASALLLEHDLLLMPSRFEAFGIALLEALASGMPVVARRAFAMPELVPADLGVLVEHADPREVATAISSVARDADIWSRCLAAADHTRSTWSWGAVAGRVLDVLA